MKVTINSGNIFKDERGSVSFVNDFKFNNIDRFYIINNSEENPIRAWQGHRLDCKNFYCVHGSFKIYFVKIDNWLSPSSDLIVESIILNDTNSQILTIPAGYANAIQSLEIGSKLISFSTLPLNQLINDDFRFDKSTWKIDEY